MEGLSDRENPPKCRKPRRRSFEGSGAGLLVEGKCDKKEKQEHEEPQPHGVYREQHIEEKSSKHQRDHYVDLQVYVRHDVTASE
jgi:hypothetical protein